LPVVTTRHHGMADMIDETCGFPLRVDSPSQLVDDLTCALRTLAMDRKQLAALAEGARLRGKCFSRENQIVAIDSMYKRALESVEG